MSGPRTRLAPTPSGRLHAGNAFSFLCAWLSARSRGGEVVLRVEDVDESRARPEHVESLFRDLEWLGLDWDEGPRGPDDLDSPFRQSSSDRRERYLGIWKDWMERDLLYPCRCTRAMLRLDAPQVESLSQASPVGSAYPGTCRGRKSSDAGPRDSWRLRLPPLLDLAADDWMGARAGSPSLGDPVLRRADGVFAYHLAVCADDADQRIDLVVRGRDLLPFAPLHAHLHRLLGSPVPRFRHHGLLGDGGGARLAKRADSTSLSAMRESGQDPRRLVGRLAPLLWPGAGLDGSPLSVRELLRLGEPVPAPGDHVFLLQSGDAA